MLQGSKLPEIVESYINEHADELYSLLSELVQINSENFGSYGNEAEVAVHIANYFDDLGIENKKYSPDDVEGIRENEDYYAGRNLGNRYNVTAHLPGKGRSLMLAAHSDTVPIGELSLWHVPPLGGIIQDGKIYGRGSNDDKYGIAIGMFLFKMIQELGLKPKCDLYFTAYSDEEFGGGNGALAACMAYPCDMYLNMDAHEELIYTTGLGGACYLLTVENLKTDETAETLVEGMKIAMDSFMEFKKRRREELLQLECFRDSDYYPSSSFKIKEAKTLGYQKFLMPIAFYTSQERDVIEAEFKDLVKELNAKLEILDLRVESFVPTTRFFRFAETTAENPEIERLQKFSRGPLNPSGSGLSDFPLFLNHGSKNSLSVGTGKSFSESGGPHQPDEYIDCDVLLDFCKLIVGYTLDFE